MCLLIGSVYYCLWPFTTTIYFHRITFSNPNVVFGVLETPAPLLKLKKTYFTLFFYHLGTSWLFLIFWELLINMIPEVCYRKWCITCVWGLRDGSLKIWLNMMDFHTLYICNWCWQYCLCSSASPTSKFLLLEFFNSLFIRSVTVSLTSLGSNGPQT